MTRKLLVVVSAASLIVLIYIAFSSDVLSHVLLVLLLLAVYFLLSRFTTTHLRRDDPTPGAPASSPALCGQPAKCPTLSGYPRFTLDMDTGKLHEGLHPKIRRIRDLADCFKKELKNIEENENYSEKLKNIFAYFKQEGAVDEIMKIVAKKVDLADKDGRNYNSVEMMVDQPVLIFIDIRPQCSLDNLRDNWKRSMGRDYLESIEGLLSFANNKGAIHMIHLFFCYDDYQSGVAIAFLPSPDTVMEIGSLFPYSMVNKRRMY